MERMEEKTHQRGKKPLLFGENTLRGFYLFENEAKFLLWNGEVCTASYSKAMSSRRGGSSLGIILFPGEALIGETGAGGLG